MSSAVVKRLVRPEFMQRVSVPILKIELQQFKQLLPADQDQTILTVLAKYALDSADGVLLASEITACIESINSNRFNKTKIVECLVDNALGGTSCNEKLKQKDSSEWLNAVITHANDSQFLTFLTTVNEISGDIFKSGGTTLPSSLLNQIPDIESRMLALDFTSHSSVAVQTVVDSIARLKLANVELFKRVCNAAIDALDKGEHLRNTTILRLVREMGWGGYMHSELLNRSTRLFRKFKQYQGLSSVWMLAGGLTKDIVDTCMHTLRADRESKSRLHPLTIEGHCQLIRRLVVCGFLHEAMELYKHFPEQMYKDVNDKNSVSQIQRLFLASFLDPNTVPPHEVSHLKPDVLKHEATGVMYHGGENSSYIHALVVKALVNLGEEHVCEYVDEPTQLTVDIFIPSRNLVLEVQGPSHYITDLATGETRMRPEDEFKVSVLKARGYRVADLSIHDFGRKNATRNADSFVSNLLAQFPVIS